MTATAASADSVGALILAAGKGTRMYSDRPKVLQRILEEPMLRFVFEAAAPVCGAEVWTVIGHGADEVRKTFAEEERRFVLQEQQLGTGHAVQAAWDEITAAGIQELLIINGDTPLLSSDKLAAFLTEARETNADLAFMTLTLDAPGAFGRVVRRNGEVDAIVEAKDYSPAVHGPEPKEINAGIYFFRTAAVGPLLPRLTNANKSGEFYITDLVGFAKSEGLRVIGSMQGNDLDLLGVNSPAELVQAEERVRARIVDELLRSGTMIHAPHSVRISPFSIVEKGAEITGPCEIYGKSIIRRGARIASHCRFENAEISEGAVIHSFTHVQEGKIGPRCIVGPYARLRPGAVMEEDAHAGNFVELKKAVLGKGAKANHLSYIGDAEVGAGANIGAGTITCNYDGKNKHVTRIGSGAFIGSNSALVAPISIGDNALVGAGSVITRNVAENELAVTRSKQQNLPRRK